MATLVELIELAPWREAVTYRETWPHEYILTEKDNQRELLAAVCQRFRSGEGVACRFFRMKNEYLFIGGYKYWLMTDYNAVDPYEDEGDYVLNRARHCTGTEGTLWSRRAIPACRKTIQPNLLSRNS